MTLHDIQSAVHVGKDKVNSFGGYNYRTAEGILAALKAALPDGATVIVDDDLRELSGQIFVEARATIKLADGTEHSAKGFALHPLTKKGMDPSQITGSASSYARKYALAGLLALDDGSADPDGAKEPYQPAPKETPPPDHGATVTRLKAAISTQPDAATLDKLWSGTKFQATLGALPDDMKADVQKAFTDRQADLFIPGQGE